MPHVDEGQLHAYLDRGPGDATASEWATFEKHLAVCEDCQARLEEARRIRGRAQEILAGAGPAEIEVPPFEALVAREAGEADAYGSSPGDAAKRSGPSGNGRKRGWHAGSIPMAWAATVMVAVGAGWMARQVTMSSAEYDSIAKRPAAEAPAGPASASGEATRELAELAQTRAAPAGSTPRSTETQTAMAGAESLDRLEAKVDDEAAGRRANEIFADNRDLPSDAAAGLADVADQRAAAKSVLVAEAEVAEAGAADAGGERARRQVAAPEPLVEGDAVARHEVAQLDADAQRNVPDGQDGAVGAIAQAPRDAVGAAGHRALGCYLLEADWSQAEGLWLPARMELQASELVRTEVRGDYYRVAGEGRLYEATTNGVRGGADDPVGAFWSPLNADSLVVFVASEAGVRELRLRVEDGDLSGAAFVADGQVGEDDALGEVRARAIDCAATD